MLHYTTSLTRNKKDLISAFLLISSLGVSGCWSLSAFTMSSRVMAGKRRLQPSYSSEMSLTPTHLLRCSPTGACAILLTITGHKMRMLREVAGMWMLFEKLRQSWAPPDVLAIQHAERWSVLFDNDPMAYSRQQLQRPLANWPWAAFPFLEVPL